MIVICDSCYALHDTRPGAYCPGCLAAGHWSPLQDEAGLRRGVAIYKKSTIPTAMAEKAIARKARAIRALNEVKQNGKGGGR